MTSVRLGAMGGNPFVRRNVRFIRKPTEDRVVAHDSYFHPAPKADTRRARDGAEAVAFRRASAWRRWQAGQARHAEEMFPDCRRPLDTGAVGCGGRVFWEEAEPYWVDQLGYAGTCAFCGWTVFTAVLLADSAQDVFRGRHLPMRTLGGLKTAA